MFSKCIGKKNIYIYIYSHPINPHFKNKCEIRECTSILAWKIPRTEDPGCLQSTVLKRVRRDWATECACMHQSHYAAVSIEISR